MAPSSDEWPEHHDWPYYAGWSAHRKLAVVTAFLVVWFLAGVFLTHGSSGLP